ncbi:xylulokinase [Tatumella sp. OPLPL6]|uniref:xylulokinase n=1 Tax=Tatumella sp. OPLPL6 TaxID=1928657 RepID=UPI000C1A7BB4|nr:xylulokinase [Tatumella sp. OPLPL6]PIJ43660.1 xylulokinase [Tatumella sp. OPLPL6]
MYLGIDLGTSGVKVVLMDEQFRVQDSQSISLTCDHPHPLWSEQAPAQWWQATEQALDQLAERTSLHAVKAIGVTGQMHGAVLIDSDGQPLRPAILWNDGRCAPQCERLNQQVPSIEHITGNQLMTGMTAPKLLWVAEHEPEIFSQIAQVLLPKDYLRWKLSGSYATDMSDASGTLWLNVATRQWDETLLEACGLTLQQVPPLLEGPEVSGYLLEEHQQRWGLSSAVPIVAGGGDNAAGALGVGVWQSGQAMLSLGTSGVYFAVSDGFYANSRQAVHSFCHALPETWHLMSVMLSAASCLDWGAKITGQASVSDFLQLAQHAKVEDHSPIFLPYLAGERTPHNDPYATGSFTGLTAQHGPAELAFAVVEGVSLGLAEGMAALHQSGVVPTSVTLIGGGAKSEFWRQLLADVTGQCLDYRQDGDVGPALGAARLAKMACSPALSLAEHFPLSPIIATYRPQPERHQFFQRRLGLFQQKYRQLSGET